MEADLTKQIDELVADLRKIAAADPERRLFGAAAHQYRLYPPLPEAELDAVERQHGIRLPPDYRLFMNRVGNGGAGPDYGLCPLPQAAKGGRPGLPFPYTRAAHVYDPGSMGLAAEDLEPEELLDENVELSGGLPPGAVLLSETGCGYSSFLVVSGAAYGTVWGDYNVADCGFVPMKLTFVGWYRRWLDRSLTDRVKELGQLRTRQEERVALQRVVDTVTPGMTRAQVEHILGPPDRAQTSGRAPLGPYTRLYYSKAGATAYLTGDEVTRVERGMFD